MQKTLTDIDGALTTQHATDARPRPDKNVDTTFGLYRKQDGQLSMGNKAVRLDVNGKSLTIDDKDDWGIYTRTSRNATDESITSDEYDEYQRLLVHNLIVLDRLQ